MSHVQHIWMIKPAVFKLSYNSCDILS
uniref:Uncharacterized protein n=1 Tax=Rhizophora mucronata TaxID=61149 RepID=A0A2P2PE91_RHIMU